MSNSDEKVAVVGGPYVEDPDFVPEATDMHGVFNTAGVGAHHDPSKVSPIFDIDKQAVAQQVVDAHDPDSPVSADNIIYPHAQSIVAHDPDEAKDNLVSAAQARLDQGPVVIGEPSEAEKEAAESGEAGTKAAVDQEQRNSSATSATTGSSTAGATDETDSDGHNVTDDGDDEEKFRPGDHTVAEVNAHLESADDKERRRVLAAEKRGQARVGIVGS